MKDQMHGPGLGLVYAHKDWYLLARLDTEALDWFQRLTMGLSPSDTSLPFDVQWDGATIPLLGPGLKQLKDPVRATALVTAMNRLAISFQRSSGARENPILNWYMGTEHSSDGRLHMGVQIAPPKDVEAAAVSQLATDVMRSIAHRMGHLADAGDWARKPKRLMRDLVWCQYDADGRTTLTVNPMGGCSIETDDAPFRRQRDVISLNQHNIYNHQQQLILLAGAVAVGQAGTLLASD